MGIASKNQCGTVEAVNTASAIEYENGKIITVHHTDEICALSQEGDSGGPWQYGNLEWTYGTAITTAGNGKSCSNGGFTISFELAYALEGLGVHLD
jgi:hypothetical protein